MRYLCTDRLRGLEMWIRLADMALLWLTPGEALRMGLSRS